MRRNLSFFLSFLLLCAVASWAQFEHPDLKSGKKQVHSMLLMPVQVEITKVGMKGAEPMMEESRQTEQALTPVVVNVLQGMGYTLDSQSLAPDIVQKDPDLRYMVDDLQKRFDTELKEMNRKAKDVRKGRFTLGDEVVKLAEGEGVDALLFVRANGQVLTGGKKAFGLLVAGPANDAVSMHFGVVDAKTGDVLYFAKPIMLKNVVKNSEQTAGGVKKSFKNFAKASPAGAAPVQASVE